MPHQNEVHHDHHNGGGGALWAVLVVIIIAVLFIVFGLPAIRQTQNPEINVPDDINVDIDGNQ